MIDGAGIEVAVHDGEVRLTGDVACSVTGVRDVANQLTIED